ncbi:uncharacterized protein LOC134450441 isoform X2 [Engraulis encrasicolus]|uniref:uncharacterized protein LOC134450441 isoform X2 n=1 Tax=Engraulis encrasicolus TaxID=184585 RepID=UPI002FCED1AC
MSEFAETSEVHRSLKRKMEEEEKDFPDRASCEPVSGEAQQNAATSSPEEPEEMEQPVPTDLRPQDDLHNTRTPEAAGDVAVEEPTPALVSPTAIEDAFFTEIIAPLIARATALDPGLPVGMPRLSTENGSASSSPPPIGEPCGEKCRRQCSKKILEDRRREIWSAYWRMSYGDKRFFVFHSVSQVQKARACGVGPSRRSRSFIYKLKDADNIPQQVCKMFFLSTLGYHPSNDSLVLSVMGRDVKEVKPSLAPPIDRRGRHKPANKLDLKPLYAHIESCPSDMSVKRMFTDYIDKGNKCSYETYRKAVKSMSNGSAKVEEEGSESCVLQDQHLRAHQMEALDKFRQFETLHQHKTEAEDVKQHYMSGVADKSQEAQQNAASSSSEEPEAREQPVSTDQFPEDDLHSSRSTDSALAGKPPMGEPCGEKCRRLCSKKIPEGRRREIWSEYWDMPYGDRRYYMFNSVSQVQKARASVGPSRRSRSFIYRLKDANNIPQQVCKMFFLSTLGYHPSNDRLVVSVMSSPTKDGTQALTPPIDRRGRHEAANKLDLDLLNAHIESCHPVTQYQRRHTPCRRYLPSDVSVKLMYADYIDKGNKCSYETYRKAVKNMNIGFAKVGEEECESCVLQDQHLRVDHQVEASEKSCHQCETWQQHKTESEEIGLYYMFDADREWSEDTSVRSVSLQKVILLPRMPGVKCAVSTKRIAAYHETFAPVGQNSDKRKTISVVWHEGIAGRNAKEIASAYGAALEKERDIRHIIYWVDNCCVQNRNWRLLSSLVSLVNSDVTSTEDITLKFFEPGHTLMSSHRFHQGVEQQMRHRQEGAMYNFGDFVSVVANSNSQKVEVIELQNERIRAWTDGHCATKVKEMPKLSELKVIQLRRWSRSIFVKTSHEEENFTELDFLQESFRPCIPNALRAQDRGVEEDSKTDIVRNLVPLMQPTKSLFWTSLPVRNSSDYEDEE